MLIVLFMFDMEFMSQFIHTISNLDQLKVHPWSDQWVCLKLIRLTSALFVLTLSIIHLMGKFAALADFW